MRPKKAEGPVIGHVAAGGPNPDRGSRGSNIRVGVEAEREEPINKNRNKVRLSYCHQHRGHGRSQEEKPGGKFSLIIGRVRNSIYFSEKSGQRMMVCLQILSRVGGARTA